MAAAGGKGRSRFAVACGVLSRCVRAEADAAAAAAAVAHARPATMAESAMLLMPGADVAPDVEEEAEAAAPGQAQLTIMYAGRVVVFDGVMADSAAEMLRLAARHGEPRVAKGIPVPRKASLQRFMEKRRDRLAANRPYDDTDSRPSKERQQEGDAGSWLNLGIPGGCVH